eukprot:PITA_04930
MRISFSSAIELLTLVMLCSLSVLTDAWGAATATWYGDAHGDGSEGCGTGHFDLSGTAISSLALPGRDAELRNVGIVNILAQRVSCNYGGQTIAFHVDPGANNYYLAVFVEFEDGAGDLGALEVQDATSNSWIQMAHVWGANWSLNSGSPLEGPFSFRLTALSGGKQLILRNAIPNNFQPGSTYRSTANY